MIPLARFLKILINSKSKSCVYVSAVNKWNPVNIENTGMRNNDARRIPSATLGMNAAANPQDALPFQPSWL